MIRRVRRWRAARSLTSSDAENLKARHRWRRGKSAVINGESMVSVAAAFHVDGSAGFDCAARSA
jgi:hypothetical protein